MVVYISRTAVSVCCLYIYCPYIIICERASEYDCEAEVGHSICWDFLGHYLFIWHAFALVQG